MVPSGSRRVAPAAGLFDPVVSSADGPRGGGVVSSGGRVGRGRRARARAQPHMRQVPSLVVTNARIAAGGRYAVVVWEARVPVSASRTARATSSGRVFRSPATVAASTQPRPGQVGAGDRVPGGDGRDDGGDVAVGFGAHLDPGQLLAGLRAEVTEADELAGVVVDDGVVVVPVVPEPLGAAPATSRHTGDDRYPEGDLGGDVHVPQQQVTERVGSCLGEGERRVHRPVLPGEALHRRPRGSTGRGGEARRTTRSPVDARPDLDGPALPGRLGCAATWSAATRPATGAPRTVTRAGSIAASRGARSASTRRHASTSRPAQASTTLCALEDRQVPREHEVPHRREPLTECRTERGLPTGEPFGHPGRQRHLRRRHRIDVPDRVDPLPRTRLPHRGLHPGTPRPEDRDQARPPQFATALSLPGELERLHRIQPVPLGSHLTRHRRAPLTQRRDAAAEPAPVHASSYRTPVRGTRPDPRLFTYSRTILPAVHEVTHSSIRVRRRPLRSESLAYTK